MFSKLYREKKIMCYWLLSYTHDSDQFRQKYFNVYGLVIFDISFFFIWKSSIFWM